MVFANASKTASDWSTSIDALAHSLASCTKCLEEAKGQLDFLRNKNENNDMMQNEKNDMTQDDKIWYKREPEKSEASGDSHELSVLPGKPSGPEPRLLDPEPPDMLVAGRISKRHSAHDGNFMLDKLWSDNPELRSAHTLAKALSSETEVVPADSNTSIASALLDESGVDGMEIQVMRSTYSKYILNPESSVRALWDIIGVMCVCYDIIFLPMQLMNPPAWFFKEFLTWLTRSFWTLDVPLSFASGYIETDGRIQLLPKKIFKRYVCTWFFLDLAFITLDWADFIFPDDALDAGTARIGKATRVLRMMRLLRLLRLLRVMQSISVLAESLEIDSVRMKLLAEIVKTLTAVFWLAHLIACGWYGVGDASKDAPTTYWFQEISELEPEFEVNLYLRYVISLHWALAQFQGGMDEFTPKNGFERTYAVCMPILTLAVFAGIISRLTSLMTQLYMLSRKDSAHFSILRQYLRQQKISSKLSSRIHRSVKFNLQAQNDGVRAESVQLLSLISKGLRIELDFEHFSRIYSFHRFFQRYTEECLTCMRKVCHEASTTLWVSQDDQIFMGGEVPEKPRMYVLLKGDLTYIHLQGWTARVRRNSQEDRSEEGVVCEQTLWVPWVHTGLLKAAVHSLICEIDAHRFQKIAVSFENADFDPRKYARAYVKIMNSRDGVSDLAITMTEEETKVLGDSLQTSNHKRTSMRRAKISLWKR